LTAPDPPMSVLILSAHPFVLDEWARWARARGIVPAPVRLASGPTPLPSGLELAPAAVCVIDACLPPVSLEGLISAVASAQPGIRLVVVSEALPAADALLLLRRGIKGLLTHADTPEQLIPAILSVARGGIWVPRDLLSTFLDRLLAEKKQPRPPAGAGLSRREADVMDGLLHNLSNKEIAGRLNISERTVKFHVSNVLSKFAVQRRADLILMSLDLGTGSN